MVIVKKKPITMKVFDKITKFADKSTWSLLLRKTVRLFAQIQGF